MVALYDLQADPDENQNIANVPQHAGLVRQMHRRLLDVMQEDADPVVRQFPENPLEKSNR
jgi:hypothetical protein